MFDYFISKKYFTYKCIELLIKSVDVKYIKKMANLTSKKLGYFKVILTGNIRIWDILAKDKNYTNRCEHMYCGATPQSQPPWSGAASRSPDIGKDTQSAQSSRCWRLLSWNPPANTQTDR